MEIQHKVPASSSAEARHSSYRYEARVQLDLAAERYRSVSNGSSREHFDDALRNYRETVIRTSQYNHDTAFDFQAANSEKSTKHFFRALDTSLRRVSIEEVLAPSGTVSSNPHEIFLRFLEHWRSEMGDPASPSGRASPPSAVMQRKLLDSTHTVSQVDHDIVNAPVTAAESASAIRHMKATSAPGMDGLTAGFY